MDHTHVRRRDGDGVGGLLDGSVTFEKLREQAITLRRQGLSRRQIRDRLRVGNNDILNRLLEGEPPPAWTKRPNAKDDLRAKAREMRSRGMTYDEIQLELGVSKSSISLWVRDLPKPPPRRSASEQAKIASQKRWEHELQIRDAARRQTKAAAAGLVGELSDRELMFIGAALYWAEGTKDKPYARRERLQFINSDPDVIQLYLAWLELLGIDRSRLRFRVHIHESADVGAAEHYWADVVGVDRASLSRTTLKKHNPKTVRVNTQEGYRGCLVVWVLDGADPYRRMEGTWYGIVGAARASGRKYRT